MLIMSPEARPGRLSRGGAIRVRRLKAAGMWYPERPSLTPEERQRRMNTASWKAACGFMHLETMHDPTLEPLFTGEETRPVLREWYDAGYADKIHGNGTGTKARDAVRERYAPDPESKNQGPTILDRLAPLTKVIDRAIFGQRIADKTS